MGGPGSAGIMQPANPTIIRITPSEESRISIFFITNLEFYVIHKLKALTFTTFVRMQNKLKITFLGTGTSQGIPLIACNCNVCSSKDSRDKRLRSSVLVQYNSCNVLIDAGPDFRQQMLNANVNHLEAILLTHEHKDHITGLDDVRAFNRVSEKAVPIYCEQNVCEAVKKDFSYAFSEFEIPNVPRFNMVIIDANTSFSVEGEVITPIRCMHNRLPILGFRIRNFAYLTDLNAIPAKEMEKLSKLDVLVIDALKHTSHISHYSLGEALQVIEELSPKKAYLTHISHGLKKHSEVLEMLPEHVEPAFDGLEIYC